MENLIEDHPDRILYKRLSYKPHFGSQKNACEFTVFVDKSGFVKPGLSKTDPSFYRPTSELVREFIASGRNVLAAQSGEYDFKTDGKTDGKDDGRDISIFDSPYEPDSADVSVELRHKSNSIEKQVLKAKQAELSKEEKEADRKALADAINGISTPPDSTSPDSVSSDSSNS